MRRKENIQRKHKMNYDHEQQLAIPTWTPAPAVKQRSRGGNRLFHRRPRIRGGAVSVRRKKNLQRKHKMNHDHEQQLAIPTSTPAPAVKQRSRGGNKLFHRRARISGGAVSVRRKEMNGLQILQNSLKELKPMFTSTPPRGNASPRWNSVPTQ